MLKKLLIIFLLSIVANIKLSNVDANSIRCEEKSVMNKEFDIKSMNNITCETMVVDFINYSSIDFDSFPSTARVIVADSASIGQEICSVSYLASTYGIDSKIIIEDDENPDGYVLCSVVELLKTFGIDSKIVIVDDENPDGFVLCGINTLRENKLKLNQCYRY